MGSFDDLIVALASPPGPAERGIVRISGAGLRALLNDAFVPDDEAAWTRCRSAERFAGKWRLADNDLKIPCGLMFWPTGRSYTGQPTAELHLPGSPPLLERVLEDVYRRGARPARPGEFTLRAFLAGKIDLVQAEGVLGVIDAQDDAELRTALDQLAGGISQRLAALRSDLIDVLSDLEAGMDFVEEDIEFISRDELLARVTATRQFVESLLEQSAARMTSRTKSKVVLAGLPNAGKSTLFNRLAGRSLALVSPEQGTTRDFLSADVAASDFPFELIDTAGWDESHAGIEGAAQSQRADQLHRADLILWCTACAANSPSEGREPPEDALALETAQRLAKPLLHVHTKCDLQCEPNQGAHAPRSESEVFVSVTKDLGIEQLLERIRNLLIAPQSKSALWLGTTGARCRESLDQARSALLRAEAAAQDSAGEELLAIDLRDALDHLGVIVGVVYTDDLLDRIFSKFCIGK